MKTRIFTTLILVISLWPFSSSAFAGSATLSWQPNSEPDLNGYNVYYGTQSRSYKPAIPVGKATSYDFSNLAEGTTYYFSVTSVDTSGNESGFSSEVQKTIPVAEPPKDTIAPVVTITQPTSGDSFVTAKSEISLVGTASDNQGVSGVSWSNSAGGNGTATGISNWSVSGIVLKGGQNTLTVSASDAGGNRGTATLLVTYTPPDTTAPAITITSPTTNATYATTTDKISLAGTASDNVALKAVSWKSSTGAAGAAAGTANWSIGDITLSEGANQITVTAIDGAGNSGTDTIAVTYTPPDTTAPAINITSPTTNATYTTTTDKLTLAGTASDNVALKSVTWKSSTGAAGTAAGTTNWSIDAITLNEGTNQISVTAIDSAGNSGTDTIAVKYTPPDTTAPAIDITSPTTNATYATTTDKINMAGTASDNVALKTVTWKSSTGAAGTATGTANWSIGAITLSEGANQITVTAVDSAGNSGTDTIAITYTPPDTTAPSITITSPTTNATYATTTNKMSLAGIASDNVALKAVSWKSSTGATGIASGTANWTIGAITLGEGANQITVTAVDSVGNSGTDTIAVTYTPPDTTAPAITITSPTTNATYAIATNKISLAGTASDNVALKAVSWKSSTGATGTAAGTANWSIGAITLREGANQITVTAVDGAGNSNTDTIAVTYTPPDTTAPSITITSPTTNATYATTTNKMSLAGTASDNAALKSVSWKSSTGATGTASGTANWSIGAITLSEGANQITVTAVDNAGNNSTDTIAVTYTPPDTTAPAINITTPTTGPTFTTKKDRIDIAGRASDNSSLKQITWRTSTGNSGRATGTENWSVSGIPLIAGQNTITVTAMDASGNRTNKWITVTYEKPRGIKPPIGNNLISQLQVTSANVYEIADNLQPGSSAYSDDGSATYKRLHPVLRGSQYIKTAQADRNNTDAAFLTFTVNKDVSVYIAHDRRIRNNPSWLSDFTQVRLFMRIGSDQYMKVYSKDYQSGQQVTLGGNGGGGGMYTVIVAPK